MKKHKIIRFLLLFAALLPLCGCAAAEEDPPREEVSRAAYSVSETSEERKTGERIEESERTEESAAHGSGEEKQTEGREATNYDNVKGLWVSQFDMNAVYTKNGAQRAESEYRGIVDMLTRRIAETGFNTVFLQIRPYGDSFCPSEYFPESKYVTGKYGRAFAYDPVEMFIDSAHEKGLSVQAWINPLRLMTPDEIKLIDPSSPLGKMYAAGELVEYEGRLYLDPARSDALELIFQGASESLSTHDFDGLHIDDYFYPTQDESFDKATFALSGKGSLYEFRISNINALVAGLYRAAKDVDERLLFGVSPAGNLDTVVKKYSADVYEWCSSNGYVDYILPQLYFGLEHGVCPFEEEAKKWASIVTSPDVKLYIGMTLGKAVAGANGREDVWALSERGKREWIDHTDVLARCMRFLKTWGGADGYSFFCLQYFMDPLTGEPEPDSALECAGLFEYIKPD